MGMCATYRYLSDKNLKELKSYYGIEDKISEEIEDSHEEVELSLDIDKMWDVLHFMLMGGRNWWNKRRNYGLFSMHERVLSSYSGSKWKYTDYDLLK